MKQHLSFLLLLITFCFACKKERNNAANTDTALNGIWTKSNVNSVIAGDTESVEFSANGDISIDRYYINPSTQRVFGYAYRYIGKYRTTGNGMMELYDMKRFGKDDNTPYVSKDKLTLMGSTPDQQYTYQLTNSKTVLTWAVVCAPNADCIGAQQYTKQ